jgi:hypothetical protein
MMRILRITGLALACLATTAASHVQQSTSILCWWDRLVRISANAQACGHPQDPDMTRALAESIARLTGFILARTDVPRAAEMLAAKRERILRDELANTVDLSDLGIDGCDVLRPGNLAYWQFIEKYPPARLRAEVAHEIALPRANPFYGGCDQ